MSIYNKIQALLEVGAEDFLKRIREEQEQRNKQYSRASPPELADYLQKRYTSLGKPEKVPYRHFVFERSNPRAKNGVSHVDHSKGKWSVINGVPHVQHEGKPHPLTATKWTPGDRPHIVDIRLYHPGLHGVGHPHDSSEG